MSHHAVVGAADYLSRFCVPAKNRHISAVRARAAALLSEETAMPTPKNEHWRYTSLRTLLAEQPEAPAVAAEAAMAGEATEAAQANTAIFSGGGWQLPQAGFGDGIKGYRLADARTATAGAGAGAGADTDVAFADLIDDFWPELAETPSSGDPFTRLNLAALDDVLLISVPAGTAAQQPLRLRYAATGSKRLAQHGLVVLRLGQDASCTLIEEEAPALDGYLNSRLCIQQERHSKLIHERLQCAGRAGWQLASLDVCLEAAANYHLKQASLGAALKRNDTTVHLRGPGAVSHIQALCLALGTQQSDHHFNILHEAGGGESHTELRGLAGESGKVVIDGRILIAEGAGQSSAHLQNPNLLLSTTAEINSKPALEIYAQDVQCSHGATIGQLDEQAGFYLRSRGIDATTANLMLVRGFAAVILDGIEDAAARDRWLEPLAQSLAHRHD